MTVPLAATEGEWSASQSPEDDDYAPQDRSYDVPVLIKELPGLWKLCAHHRDNTGQQSQPDSFTFKRFLRDHWNRLNTSLMPAFASSSVSSFTFRPAQLVKDRVTPVATVSAPQRIILFMPTIEA